MRRVTSRTQRAGLSCRRHSLLGSARSCLGPGGPWLPLSFLRPLLPRLLQQSAGNRTSVRQLQSKVGEDDAAQRAKAPAAKLSTIPGTHVAESKYRLLQVVV